MDKKTTAIVATLAAVVLCGCPGLFAIFMGAMFAGISRIPGADIDMGGSSDPQNALYFGLGGICLGLVFILIAVVVTTIFWRRKG
jgi:hypothetical protein